MKKQIKAATAVDADFYNELQGLFDDFVDDDITELAIDGEQFNQLSEATDRLFERLLNFLDIPKIDR